MIIYGPTCETTGLSPVDNELVSVQFADADGSTSLFGRWEHDDEAQLLSAFLERWEAIKRKRSEGGALFVGVNHLTFDVPFVLARCMALRDDLDALGWPATRCWNLLYRWPVYFDLAHLVGSDLVGLDALRAALLGGDGDHGGREVPVLYRNERYGAIETHIEKRLTTLRDVHLTLRGTDLYRELVKFRRDLGVERDLT